MDIFIKLPVVLVLIFIVFSLFQGMYYLSKDDGENDRTRVVRALTIRIVLSFVLFVMLILGYLTGILQPHGI
ncbi:MAG: twin transmembrane helix small protein [Sedimenticola sp.]|nr:twin transmembrane helix small protein [Sedimenticola sp.]MCW8881992.1 twin transmembrane helix small protein [Sedimenticola sp.]MCW8946859.1 twin transmembrane helix small protein [Sedimenticola sp.]MCW8976764.1 twin transmembrane helix small protein [Sedimenticola sp.]MCW9021326.1 twin transmembrane helix small protein [Sedimenticola sp.]